MLIRTLIFAILPSLLGAAEKMNVKIVDRQDNATVYNYVVPAYSQTNATGNVNCTAYPNSVGCQGASNSTTIARPPIAGQYQVTGATLTLELPDGRRAVVNCAAKRVPLTIQRRSCKVPMVADIQAEFSGDDAKLLWVVSVDGKKLASEVYKILAVLPKP